MLSTFLTLCLVALVVPGCAARRVAPDDAASRTGEIVVRRITYDANGLPVIGEALSRRPSGPGDAFSVVRLEQGRPEISYDVVVRRQQPDFGKPFQAVYEWTGRGFVLGAHLFGALATSGIHVETHNRNDAAVELAVLAAPLAAGTAGGFIVGLAQGARETAEELHKVVTTDEAIVTRTAYEYDAWGRLAFMRMFTPDGGQELVRTEFVYEGAARVPSRTVVRSLLEDVVRSVRQ